MEYDMANKIYPGISAFFANRTQPNDNHNWLVNHARPFLSLTFTDNAGKRTYDDLFLTDKVAVKSSTKTFTIKAPANSTVIVIPNNLNRPLFNIAHKA